MKNAELLQIVVQVVDETRRVLHDLGLSNNCIEASSILTKALHGLGLTNAYPLNVGGTIWNPAGSRFIETNGGPPNDATMSAFDACGGARTSLGKLAGAAPLGRWAGHLVVIVPNDDDEMDLLIDLTLAQVNQPEDGVRLQPVTVQVEREFTHGGVEVDVVVNDSTVIYEAFPDDDSYLDEGDCFTHPQLTKAAEAILGRLKSRSAGSGVGPAEARMRMEQSARLLDAVSGAVLQELRENELEHHCIHASGLLVKVLHAMGFEDARLLTVGVSICNAKYLEWIELHGPPHDQASFERCVAFGGMRSLVGKGTEGLVPEEEWPGHLVVVLPRAFGTRAAMFDLTLPQGNSVEHGIELPPVCLPVPDEYVFGSQPYHTKINGCHLTYEAHPEDHSYNEDGDVLTDPSLGEAVKAVLANLRTAGIFKP